MVVEEYTQQNKVLTHAVRCAKQSNTVGDIHIEVYVLQDNNAEVLPGHETLQECLLLMALGAQLGYCRLSYRDGYIPAGCEAWIHWIAKSNDANRVACLEMAQSLCEARIIPGSFEARLLAQAEKFLCQAMSFVQLRMACDRGERREHRQVSP